MGTMKLDAGDAKVDPRGFAVDPLEIAYPTGEDFQNGRHFDFTDEDIQSMADSLLGPAGQLQPSRVRKIPGTHKLEIYSGFRRLAGALRVREKDPNFKLRVLVETVLSNKDAFIANIVENVEIKAVNLIDAAFNMKFLQTRYAFSEAEAAAIYKFDRHKYNRVMKLIGLPERVQRKVAAGTMALDAALLLIGYSEKEANDFLDKHEKSLNGKPEVIEETPDGRPIQNTLVPIVQHRPMVDGPKPEKPTAENSRPAEPKEEPVYDKMTGKPLNAAAKAEVKAKKAAAKAASGSPKITRAMVAKDLREAGNVTKRSLSDLRKVLQGREDEVSKGILGFLEGTTDEDALGNALDDASDAIFARENPELMISSD